MTDQRNMAAGEVDPTHPAAQRRDSDREREELDRERGSEPAPEDEAPEAEPTAPEAEPSAPEAEPEAPTDESEQAAAPDYKDQWLRAVAELDNVRKRARRDVGVAESRGIARLAKELLGALTRVGIEPDSPKGEAFDPHLHEAVAQQPVEGAEPGTIVEVYQSGYRYG